MFENFGEKLCSKRYDTNDLKTSNLNSSERKKIAMTRKSTFLVFLQFGERLRRKRFDPNHLKNMLFGLLRALKDCHESKNKHS